MTRKKSKPNQDLESKDSQIQNLLDENPWILEYEGFAMISFGLPLRGRVEDELGLVVSVQTQEDVPSIKRLFRKKFGSSRRWKEYPIHFDVTGPLCSHEE